MREAAQEVILPRFERLQRHEVEEKSPGEIVTVVDRLVERQLSAQLRALLAGSLVVGEEAVAADPALLQHLDDQLVWLVDPLDGTANFVAGDPRFAVMIALLRSGETIGSWLLDVPNDRLARAELGAGAFLDDRRISRSILSRSIGELRGAVLTRYMPVELRKRIELAPVSVGELLPGMRCAGLEYPAVASGSQHFALFWRTLPWDHAPGALFLVEAGGRAARLDGRPYRPVDGRQGLLAAADGDIWTKVSRSLLG